MDWQQQAQIYLSQDPKQAVQLYEQGIESEPERMEYYWYLGLAYILSERIEEAQSTWFLGLMEFSGEEFQEGLAEVLDQEAKRQKDQGQFQLSQTLRLQLAELVPEDFNNLLHLVELSIDLGIFHPATIETKALINHLSQNDNFEVDDQLLLRVLERLLELPDWKTKPFMEAAYSYLKHHSYMKYANGCYKLSGLTIPPTPLIKGGEGGIWCSRIFWISYYVSQTRSWQQQRLFAAVALRAGEIETSMKLLETVLISQPKDAETLEYLGRALEEQAQLEQAQHYYQDALQLDETRSRTWNRLGEVQVKQKQLEAAAASFEQALILDPNYTVAIQNQGLLCREKGDLEKTIHYFEQVLELDPSYWHASFWISRIYWQQGEARKGIPTLKQALALYPEEALLHNALGLACMEIERFQEAVNCFQNALNLGLNQATIYSNLGSAYTNLGNLEKAITAYQQALDLNPNDPKVHCYLGEAHQQLGQLNEAGEYLRQAISLNPNYAAAYFSFFRQHKASWEDPYFQQLLELATKKVELTSQEQQWIDFALAKAWDDIGNYKKAFQHLEQANASKHAEADYSIEDLVKAFQTIQSNFDLAIIRSRSLEVTAERIPIFIVGMMRSGTTLTEQIISSHSQVAGLGELLFLMQSTRGEEYDLNKDIHSASQITLQEARNAYLKKINQLNDSAPFFTDKNPTNFSRIGLIKILFPEAKIVHCIRHPLDVCLSMFQQFFYRSYNQYAYSLEQLGQYYLAYHQLMEYWYSILPDFIYSLRYEELITNPEIESQKLLDFCGLEWEDKVLEFNRNKRPVRTCSSIQARQKIYSSSVYKWENYAEQLAPLKQFFETHGIV